MHAEAVPLQRILDGNLQMIIPIFQREYSWEREQVKTLWEDIVKLYKNIEKGKIDASHFLGPIVRVDISSSSVDTRKLLLIDGQQRIITLMTLFSCLRNIIRYEDDDITKKIESGYLVNIQEKGENFQKLIPSEGDRLSFNRIIKGENNLTESRLKNTYEFFTKKLESNHEKLDFEKLRGILVKNLILVHIDVDKNENPYLIFESLNAKGTPLTQADLIRNYLFMKIEGEEKQRELYHKYWRPMEVLLKNELARFFWRYTLKDGTFIKIGRTYANLKTILDMGDTNRAEYELKELYEYSLHYGRLINPQSEPDDDLGRRFVRHNRWEIRTAYPFILNIYNDYSKGILSLEQFYQILDIIESFVIRRFFCREPTNKLNSLFIRLYHQIDKGNFINSLYKNLIKDWPDDEQFIEGLRTFPIYTSGAEKCSLILESIEEVFSHKEPVEFSRLQIEHIMPQAEGNSEKLNEDWKEMLGDDYQRVHTTFLHTIGNLTLTGYNQDLWKKPFSEKKEILKESHLEMNKYFEAISVWNEDAIIKRAEILSQKAICIWKYPEEML